MIIRELYLKNFGKFSETKIELEEGFHIFTEKMSSEKYTACFYQKYAIWTDKRARKGSKK